MLIWVHVNEAACSVVLMSDQAEEQSYHQSDLRTNQALIWLNEKEEGERSEEDIDDFISLKQIAHHQFTDRMMLIAHKNGKRLSKMQADITILTH